MYIFVELHINGETGSLFLFLLSFIFNVMVHSTSNGMVTMTFKVKDVYEQASLEKCLNVMESQGLVSLGAIIA